MRRDSNQQKIAIAVGIALSAGMFSIVPVAYGAPVGGTVTTGGASIAYSDAANGGRDTSITSTTMNNVIDWQDFSVAKGEKVVFDGGTKDPTQGAHNYMNIVSGMNTSQIDGAIKGGNEVYIINPNGVIFGETASVDVGSLYASTRYVSSEAAVAAATAEDMTTVLADTSAGVATDVVNLGTIKATNVVMEGQNVRFVNDSTKTNDGGTNVAAYQTTGVTASSVTLKADTADGGYIHVGNRTGYAVTGYSSLALTDGNDAADVEYYKLLGTDWQTVKTTINNAPAGAYMLSGNIDASSSPGGITSDFKGSFDGNYYEISGLTGASGLFASTSGAKIYNVGVVNSTISSSGYAGGIVASASASDDGSTNTILRNVYNTATVSGGNGDKSGGLVGSANGVDIIQSYNTGEVGNGEGSAFIGYIDSGTTNSITDSYNTGNVYGGIAGGVEEGASLTVDRVYTKASAFWGNEGGTTYHSNVLLEIEITDSQGTSRTEYRILPASTAATSQTPDNISSTAISSYIGSEPSINMNWGSSIANTGGVSIDTNRYILDSDGNPTETINTNYGKVTRPTWRIYEGKSTPMLTSQFKGIKTTVYDYGYFKANGTLDSEAAKYNNGSNGGKDMPAYTGVENNLPNGLVYNGEYLKIVSNVTNEDGSVTTTAATSTDGKLADVSLAFNTNGLSTIDGSHILYDAAGRKDATFTKEANSQTEGTQNVLALLYSDQTGYDLVGNNIAIAPRKVSVSTDDIGSVTIVKEYDGTSTANSAVTDSLFSGDSSTVTGILDGDDASVSFAGTATFTNNGAAAKAVGVYTYDTTQYNYTMDSSNPPPAYVNLDGTITLTDTTNNYLLDGDGSLKGWAQGAITQKAITVSLNGGPYTKTYDKNAIAKGVADDGTLINEGAVTIDDFNFATDAIITTGEGSSEVSEDVALAFADKAYFVNADDNESSSAGDYTNRVRFGGLQLSGNDKGNYKLVDSEGNVLYSYSKLITTSTDLQGNVTINQAESGVNTDNGGALYASGSIDKRNISSKNFEWYTGTEDNKNWFGGDTSATRPYSGSAVYTEPVGFNVSNERSSDRNSGMLAGDSLTFAVQSARFVTSDAWDSSGTEGTGTHLYNSTKNVADAQGVVYTVSITGDAAGNYTLDGESINTTTGGTNTVIGAGTITPRTLNLIVNANADMDKVYDGNAYVTGATENNPAYLTDAVLGGDTGFLKYQDTDADHHFLGDDANAKIKVVGTYQVTGNDYSEAKNVNYDAANNTALAKDIVYEATVMEGDAESSNYKFAIINTGNTVVEATNTDATKADFKGTDAQGIINQREIDKIVFADVEKTYDGSSVVTNTTNNGDDVTFKTNDRITITDLQLGGTSALSVTGEAISDVFDVDANGQIAEGTDNALISGVYGEGNDWQANEHAGTKVVHYTISDGLWKNHNYKLTSDAKLEGVGTINQLEISPDDIKLERNDTVITKVYNGDDDVATVADNVGNVNRSVTDYLTQRQAYVSKDGHELDIAVSVDGANYETSHHTNDSGSTDLTVNYTVSLVNATDYTIKDTNGDSVTQITRDEDANGHKITGTISARPITVTTADIVNNNVENGGLTKVYDATANANGSGESLVSGINSQILSADQTGGVANATTGTYNNKHANSNDTSNLDANGLKTVTYALQLDHNDYGDYKFVNASGSDISQIEGKGTIKKRSLTLTTTVHPEKTYSNGSPEVETDDMPTADDINFGSTENNNVVALDGFTATALTGAYQITGTEENAGDVNRAADRSVLDKNIIYSGVLAALGTENAGNYEVEDTFTGTGRIDPNTINYLDFQFVLQDNIRQTYSGNNTVGEYGMEGDALTNFQKGWIDKDNSGIKIGNDLFKLADGAYGISSIESARFDDANADTGKTVTYRIHVDPDTLQNYDYIETYTDNTGTEHTVAKDSIYLDAVNNTGIIDKRAVVASVTHDTLEKYYDGTEKIYNGDNAAYSGAASGTELSGADAVTFADVVADGTTTQTGLLDGTNVSTGAYDGTGVGTNNKTINYTAKVDAAHSGNYKFVDSAGNELTNGQGTALTTTQNTINPFGVVVTAADTSKVYDGDTALDSVETTAKTKAQTALQLGHNYDTGLALSNITADTGVYDNPNVNNGAAHKVTYTGFTLNNDNYYLVDADGKPIATDNNGNNVITGKGYISKYTLTDLPNFTIHDVTKEYDGDGIVKYNRSEDKNLIKEHFVTAENLPGTLAYELVSATYTDANRGENNKHVDFVINVSGDNYDFQQLIVDGKVTAGTNGIRHTYTADNASITPRKVYVALKGDTDISKVYDGGTKLENADLAAVRTANQEIYIPDASDILSDDRDNVHIDWAGIQAEYTSKDADDDIDVKYTISLTNNDAGNYVLYKYAENPENATQITDANKLTGTGAITKATFTIEPVLLEKTYNGSALIGQNGAANGTANWSSDNLVFTGVTPEGGSQETFTLSNEAFAKVTGQYGTGAGDANVSWSGDEVAYKDVYLTGLAEAMELMAADGVAKNYTLDNSAYADGTALFKASAGKGRINPVDAVVNKEWVPVTREYNRTASLDGVKGLADGQDKNLQDILKLTIDAIDGPLKIDYQAEGHYNGVNKGDDHTLTYTITDGSVSNKVWDGTGYNYRIDASALNGQTFTSDANNQIKARTLNVITDDAISKVYDGKYDVESADKKAIHFSAKDENLLALDNVSYSVEAHYADKNANVGNTDTRINVPYTITLSGNTLENYKLSDANINEVSGTTVGDITKRPVYVVAQNVTGIDRDYRHNSEGEPDDSLPDDFNSADNHFTLQGATVDSGIVSNDVTDDSDITLNTQNVTGRYASPHVQREADGSVTSQDVIFSGFALGDDSIAEERKANYTFAGEVKGSGTIKPLPITVDIKNAPTKEYDGSQALSTTYAANTNLTPNGLLGTDNANIIIKKAEYDNANAGTNKAYTYDIELGNGDYSLTQGANSPKITVSSYGTKGVISASDGTIDKRTITATVNGVMSKEYDGTTAGTENAAANISLGNVLSGENVGLTAKAVYDNPNAGKSEDSDELQNHRVTYTLNLSNPNYQLADDTVTGTGTISRKGLNIVATPVSINNGEAMPKFSGTVEGLVSGDENLTSSFVFDTLPTVTNVSVGSNPVYGWYRNSYDDGNLGLNYTYQQDPANAAAFTVNYVDSGRNNPDTKITPTNNIYQQISKDKGSGFGDNAAAALEYVDKNGQVIARETIDSGEIHDGGASLGNADDMTSQDTSLANIGIVGGDIVNVDGADAANMANIEVTDNGTTVNLEITSLSSGESGDKQAVAEITSVPAAADNSSAQIQNLDDRQDILEQITNKEEEQEKEGEIAIESKSSQNDDEIELTVEGNGVNVA